MCVISGTVEQAAKRYWSTDQDVNRMDIFEISEIETMLIWLKIRGDSGFQLQPNTPTSSAVRI